MQKGKAETVKFLIESGADANAKKDSVRVKPPLAEETGDVSCCFVCFR